jgi:Na+-driven multidrug efflux pump
MAFHYLKLAIPAVVNAILMNLIWQMNIVAVVRMGSTAAIAGVGLGTVTLNMLCHSLILGANGAQETLTS